MEKSIINNLDNLTIDQTESLLDGNIRMRISDKDRNRIKNSVFDKIDAKNKKRIYIPKKLVACAVAITIIFTAFSIIGFANIAASINRIFTFIPGVGITERSEDAIYMMYPIVSQIEYQNAKANIVSAVYENGYLNMTIEVVGNIVYQDDFALYINQEPANCTADSFGGILQRAFNPTITIANLSYKHCPMCQTEILTENDIYEIAITGFPERLSFKMVPSRNYDDIRQIGPTDIQNGIAVTATAQRIDNQLIIWCYSFRINNNTEDIILSYGQPANGSFNKQRHIVTESSIIYENFSALSITRRLIFDIPDNDRTATLHIPYLAMLRDERSRLNISLPRDHTTVDSDFSVETSLGTIRVIEIKREPNNWYHNDKDTVRLKFQFESNDNNMQLYSFGFPVSEDFQEVVQFNAEKGSLEYLLLAVERNTNRISLNITSLFYYMFGEYVISLDIQ